MAVARAAPGGYLERPRPSGLADVIDVILDKGLVIDSYVRVSLIGIEILTIDARIVIASVDTYLRFAEAVGRLDIAHDDQSQAIAEQPSDGLPPGLWSAGMASAELSRPVGPLVSEAATPLRAGSGFSPLRSSRAQMAGADVDRSVVAKSGQAALTGPAAPIPTRFTSIPSTPSHGLRYPRLG